MIKLENTDVMGWEHVIRGMRNPMNSWEMSDSHWNCNVTDDSRPYGQSYFVVESGDHELMMKLAKGGSVHAKYRRMITVYVDITAPLYWWKEFDTYKVGTVANSTSTMHKIHAKGFVLDDFSHEHLIQRDMWVDPDNLILGDASYDGMDVLEIMVGFLNFHRNKFISTNDKKYWWQMIQLLPSSYNQKRTIMMNYEVLTGIYPMRKDHKLDEWHEFCRWIEGLPYSEIMIGEAV